MRLGGMKRVAWPIRSDVEFAARRAAMLLAFVGFVANEQAMAAPACKPKRPKPPIFLKNMGPCVFDPARQSFDGNPVQQASCLLRGMDASRNLVRTDADLPPTLASRLDSGGDLPSREALSGHLSRLGLEWELAAYLWRPLSRARDNDPDSPQARYFVIHDTSGPSYGRRAFPADINTRAKINDLRNFKCGDGWEKAHAVINRAGAVFVGHDFGIPWRETKFERARNFDGALKGLFLHVELVQPRRHARGLGRRNDAQTPNPAFTPTQYDTIALLYTVASVRRDGWMIPAFHAAIDAGIPGGHDDPLGFDVEAFAASLDRLLDQLRGHARPHVSRTDAE